MSSPSPSSRSVQRAELVNIGSDAVLKEKTGRSTPADSKMPSSNSKRGKRSKHQAEGAKQKYEIRDEDVVPRKHASGFSKLSGQNLSNKLRLARLGGNLWNSNLPQAPSLQSPEPPYPTPHGDPLSPDAFTRKQRHNHDAETDDRALRVDPEGQYARQTKEKTWQQIGRIESALERPATRRDIALLDKQFDRAVHASQREIRQTRKPGTGLMAEARMEQDIVAVKEFSRKLVERPQVMSQESSHGDHLEILQESSEGEDLNAICEDWEVELANVHGVQFGLRSKQRDLELQNMLAASFFEEKWSDLILGELQSQVTISCLEQGQLLAKVRAQLAMSFSTLSDAQSLSLQELHDTVRAMLFYKEKASELALQQRTIREEVAKEYQTKIVQTEARARERYAEYEQQIKLVKASQKRMADTLAALNGIYRKMRDDAETMRNLDAVDACDKLEKKLIKAQSELDELRPLRAQCEELTRTVDRQASTIEDQVKTIENLKEELEQRNGLVQSLMDQHSAHLSLEELGKEHSATGVKHASDETFEDSEEEEESDEDDEEEDDEEADGNSEDEETNAAGDPEAVADTPEEGEEAVQGALETSKASKKGGKKKKKVAKKGGKGAGKGKKKKKGTGKKSKKSEDTPFITSKKLRKTTDTSKIPDEGDIRFGVPGASGEIREGMDLPSTAKTFLCPRCNVALDRAGNIDEAAMANSDNRLACEGYRMLLPNLMGYRPERSRQWVLRCMRSIIRAKRCADFSAARMGKPKMRFPEFVYMWFTPRKERLDELQSFEGQEAVLLAKAEADESRWGLYYGLKRLAKELPEARVFYTFLDEKYGEDDFAFYLHCLTIMEAVVNERRGKFDWGFNTNACDYDAMHELEEEQGGADEIDDFIFVEIRHAVEVTERVMKRATEDDCKRAVKTLVENAVQEEIRITPTTGQRIIDINVCLRVLLQEYRDEQAHRRAALRVMFGCASSGPEEQIFNKVVDLGQMVTIVQTLNSRAGPAEAVTLYRMAYEIGRGKVNIDAFTQAANRLNFFTDCLRLPSHFGTEAPNTLSAAQCAQLGTIVRKQMALIRPIVDTFLQRLDPPARRQLQHLVYDVADELERGGVQLDGRRALCAIRRLLFFLVGERNGHRELFGEQDRTGDVAVVNAKRELEVLCTILRDFNKDDREERMEELQLKSSAARIQKKWRARQELAPNVPHGMRKLLSACFEPGIIIEIPSHAKMGPASPSSPQQSKSQATEAQPKEGEAEAKVRRRLLRAPALPEQFVLVFLEDVYRFKVNLDTMIGQTMTLEEAVHGTAMSLFGIRVFAERFIHDFFFSVHQHAKANLRIRLFARFTGVRTPALLPPKPKSALDPIFDMDSMRKLEHEIGYGLENDWSHEPMTRIWPKALQCVEAAHTYVAALIAVHQAAGCEPSDPLFVDKLPLPKAIGVVKAVFRDACNPSKHRPCGLQPSARVVEECMTRLERLPISGGKIEAEKLILIILQGWHAEQIYRARSLHAIYEPGETPKDAVVSLVEFSEGYAPNMLDVNLSVQPLHVLSMYRELTQFSEPFTSLQPDMVQSALHAQHKSTWAPRPIRNSGSVGSNGVAKSALSLMASVHEGRWQLLVYYWQPLEVTINEVVMQLKNELPTRNLKLSSKKKRAKMRQEDIDREDDEYARTLERRRILCNRLDEALEIFVYNYGELLNGGAQVRNETNVEDVWVNLRSFLHVLQLARLEIDEASEPIADRWDQERLERMRPPEKEPMPSPPQGNVLSGKKKASNAAAQ